MIKYYWKIALIILIVGLGIAGYFIYQKNTTPLVEQTLINFNNNYQFSIPNDFTVDSTSVANTVIVMPKYVEQYTTQNYVDLLKKGGIIIKTFPSFNKNDSFFETYIKNSYKSNDTADFDISFEKNENNDIATVNVKYKDEKLKDVKEYIKIVNLTEPLIISSSGPSENMNLIVKSICNINQNDEDLSILEQIKSIGTLLKSGMYTEVYSLFSTDLKNKLSENDFKTILKDSENILKRDYSFNSGALNNKNKEFSFNIIFNDPKNAVDFRAGNFSLKKEKDKWLISKIEIPKDSNDSGEQKPINLDQDTINKALENQK